MRCLRLVLHLSFDLWLTAEREALLEALLSADLPRSTLQGGFFGTVIISDKHAAGLFTSLQTFRTKGWALARRSCARPSTRLTLASQAVCLARFQVLHRASPWKGFWDFT